LSLSNIYSQSESEKELKRLNARINRSNVRLDSLEMQNKQLIPKLNKSFSENSQSQRQIDSVSQSLNEKIMKMEEKISILEVKTTYLENKLLTLTNSYKELVNMSHQPISKPKTKKLSAESYKQKYNESLRFYQNGEFEIAATGFALLVEDDPLNPLADNSQYWLGECYYSKMEFKRAISEFQKVNTFQGTDKDDDAQLKIAMAYLSMENKKEAKDQFQKFLNVFPESEYTLIARESLKQISLD